MKEMKKLWQFVVAVVFFTTVFACKTNNKLNIDFTPVTVADSSSNYSDDTTINNVISIDYFEVKCKNCKNSIVDTINQDFFAWLKQFFFADSDDMVITKDNLKDIIASEIKTFLQEIKEDELLADCESCRHVEFSVGSSVYQNDSIISLVYGYYQYSGGAHGIYGCTAYNYSKKDGTPITIENLSTNIDELTAIAKKAFVEQNGELTDYWFENDEFYLPYIFYFKENKIEFYYNIYEIAAYAAGAVIIELNNNDVKHLIDYLN